MVTRGQAARLCLVVTAEAGAAVAERLSAALGAADIAAVILAPLPARPLDATIVRSLIGIIQKAGVAALVAGDARLARTLKADGVHLPFSGTPADVYEEAREIVGSGVIIGMDAGHSRHDAMMLGEAGADYIGFSTPTAADDQLEARDRRLDLIDWWAEIFEPPCMALDVASPDEAAALASVGGDFIAVTLPDGISIADTRDLAAAYAQAITHAAAVR